MSDPTPNRRWFRISLWTLFAVSVLVGCWLAYQLTWVHQRDQFRTRYAVLLRSNFETELGGVETYELAPDTTPMSVRVLSLFGEEPRQGVMLIFSDDGTGKPTDNQKSELEAARMLFPESWIMWKLIKNPDPALS